MFNINSLTVSPDDVVLSINWTYTNPDGSRGGTYRLPMPPGSVSYAAITEATLLGWLADGLPDDVAEQLDAQIAKDNEQALIREVPISDLAVPMESGTAQKTTVKSRKKAAK